MYKQKCPFGTKKKKKKKKKNSDICPRSLSVSEKQTVFREQSSRKTVSFEELIMSKEKYPSFFFFRAKWRLLSLLSFKYFSQHAFGEYHWIFPRF